MFNLNYKNMRNLENNQNKWLSSDEVCHLLMISKRTLQTYRDQKTLSFAQIGRKIYYKSLDIDDYLDRHYIKARVQGGTTL
jgi:excisionase family DNA binding protein